MRKGINELINHLIIKGFLEERQANSAKKIENKKKSGIFTNEILLTKQVSPSLVFPGECTINEDCSRKRGAVYGAINESHG